MTPPVWRKNMRYSRAVKVSVLGKFTVVGRMLFQRKKYVFKVLNNV